MLIPHQLLLSQLLLCLCKRAGPQCSRVGWRSTAASMQEPGEFQANFAFSRYFSAEILQHVSNDRQFVLLLPHSGFQILFSCSVEEVLCTGKLLGLWGYTQFRGGCERVCFRVSVLSSLFSTVSAGFGSLVLHEKQGR